MTAGNSSYAEAVRQASCATLCDASTVDLITKLLGLSAASSASDDTDVVPTKGPSSKKVNGKTFASHQSSASRAATGQHKSTTTRGAQVTGRDNASKTVARSRPGKTVAALKRKEGITVLEDASPQVEHLPSAQKTRLATEVVNVSLKALTEAAKIQAAAPKGSPRTKKLSQTSSGVSETTKVTETMPLQSRSINRLSKTPSDKPSARRSSTCASKGPAPEIIAVAECARLAFAFLRKGDSSGGEDKKLPGLQLETGLSALIGKMIALGLDDLAIKDLRVLIRRLCPETIAPSKLNDRSQKLQKEPSPAAPHHLHDLLRFRDIPDSPHATSLLVTAQLHILRLLASRRRPSAIEAACQHLEMSCASSPFNLIEKGTDPCSPESRAKAARLYEQFAQVLGSFCPNASTREDLSVSESKRYPSPHCVLRYQLLALRFRQRVWQSAEVKSESQREGFRLFIGHFRAFLRRSQLCLKTQYGVLETIVTDFLEVVASTTSSSLQTTLANETTREMYRALADLARDAHGLAASVSWAERSLLSAEGGQPSKAMLCSILCHVSQLKVHALLQGNLKQDPVAGMKRVVALLSGDLSGSSTELDDLLIMLSNLRKVSVSLLLDKAKADFHDPVNSGQRLECLCKDVILLNINFLIRYAGRTDNLKTGMEVEARHKHRIGLVSKVLGPSIEAVTVLARTSLIGRSDAWTEIDASLQDCERLLTNIGDLAMPSGDQTVPLQSRQLFVILSNAYWCRFLDQKQTRFESCQLQKLLQRSIDLLQGRPTVELEAGFLHIKYEKLGTAFEFQHEWQNALNAYSKALDLALDFESVKRAFKEGLQLSSLSSWSEHKDLRMLQRILFAYSKVNVRFSQDGQGLTKPYVNPEMDQLQQGMLLEIQLSNITSLISRIPITGSTSQLLKQIWTSLQDIYREAKFPLRHLRAATLVLKGQFMSSGAYDASTINEVCSQSWEIPALNGTNDAPHTFKRHMIARFRSYVALISPEERDPSLLRRSLEVWKELVSTRSSWEDFSKVVDDIPDWIGELEMIGDYLHMQGEDELRLSILHLLSLVRATEKCFDIASFVIEASAFGRQLMTLGYSGRAGAVLHKAQDYVDEDVASPETALHWYLAYSEYSLGIGNIPKGEEAFSKAYELYQTLYPPNDAPGSKSRPFEVFHRICLASELLYVESLCALSMGNPAKAVFCARKSSKFAYRAWALLERQQTARNNVEKLTHGERDSSPDLQASISTYQPGQPVIMSTKHESLTSAAFWPLVPRLFRYLMHLADVLSQQGILSETVYYIEQASKIAHAVRSNHFQVTVRIMQSNFDVRAGKPDQGLSQLLEISRDSEGLQVLTQAQLQLTLARAHSANGDLDEEATCLNTAKNLLKETFHAQFLEVDTEPPAPIEDLSVQLQSLDLGAKTKKQARSNRTKPPATTSRVPVIVQPVVDETKRAKGSRLECVPLLRHQAGYLRQQSDLALRLAEVELAVTFLASAEELPCFTQDSVAQALSQAQLLLHQGLEILSTDPVLGLLQESAITCPSIALNGRTTSKPQTEDPHGGKTRTVKSTAIAKIQKAKQSARAQEMGDFLSRTVQALAKVHTAAQGFAPSNEVHAMAEKLCKSLMILSAACPSNGKVPLSSCFAAYAMEIGRSVSMLREKATIAAERMLETDQDSVKSGLLTRTIQLEPVQIDAASFQNEYIDIIPENWTAVSISLSEKHDELRLSKMRAGQVPFILVIPLSRHSSRDFDEEVFGFDEGKAELQEIIGLANFSTHDKRDMSQKGAKTEWWEARAALDARLKDLLLNIENIWLGGFKGVLSPQKPLSGLLSRFQQSFSHILGKHLPSRRKKGKGGKQDPVALDPQVLELFVSLGNPAEVGDLDEPLMDLLYFVVDILQFHGERNAYDEIDFDPIVIETLDALCHYHNTAKESCEGAQHHTILILDKHLHALPWESLPCLAGQAVSRLPSLSCLRDRILMMQKQEKNSSIITKATSIAVDRTDGAYILNPSSDLLSTQQTFTKPLSSLTSWTATLNRTPSERDILTQLTSQSIYLYFGHGSGGQYVRSRAIKKLDRCAVALLMGCSSAAMTEAGEFESYGTPLAYLHAGSPAVVGTLWDVTDRDVDRFSLDVLVRWGLVDGSGVEKDVEREKDGEERKGKRGKRKEVITAKEKEKENLGPRVEVSLDQAVADARQACIFRYLNGAAPIVYGVPVSLA